MAFMNLNENITPYQFEPCVSDTELDKSDDESVMVVEEVDEETFVENNLTNWTKVNCDTHGVNVDIALRCQLTENACTS